MITSQPAVDTGTPELSRRHALKLERGMGVVRVRSITGTPIERMLFLGMITEEEYGVLDDLLADMYRCGHVGLKAQNLEGVRVSSNASGDASSKFIELRIQTNHTLRELQRRLGTHCLSLLYELISDGPGLSKKRQLASQLSHVKLIGSFLLSRKS